jgi:CubicO group peptidase (beta-lactamase class C family)
MNLSFKYNITSTLFSILFAALSVQAQVTSSQIDSLVSVAMSDFNVAGLAIGVVQDGKIIHSKGYGYANAETKKPVTENTNFAIASNSKAFTATAMAILVEEGKLKWDTKVKSIVPEFAMYNSYVTDNFTIEDLLSHHSGMGLGQGDLMWFPDGNDFKIDDMITAFADVTPESGFRTEMQYNNILFFK